MRTNWRIALIWACFFARLAFYANMLPLWEGFDEWAHFSVIRTMATRHQALVSREEPIPQDVARSLETAPVPWQLRDFLPPSVTQDVYWQLPAGERAQRERSFRAASVESRASGHTAYVRRSSLLFITG